MTGGLDRGGGNRGDQYAATHCNTHTHSLSHHSLSRALSLPLLHTLHCFRSLCSSPLSFSFSVFTCRHSGSVCIREHMYIYTHTHYTHVYYVYGHTDKQSAYMYIYAYIYIHIITYICIRTINWHTHPNQDPLPLPTDPPPPYPSHQHHLDQPETVTS